MTEIMRNVLFGLLYLSGVGCATLLLIFVICCFVAVFKGLREYFSEDK